MFSAHDGFHLCISQSPQKHLLVTCASLRSSISWRDRLKSAWFLPPELLCSKTSTHVKNGRRYVYKRIFSVKCVWTPQRTWPLFSSASFVCVTDTLGCLSNSLSSAPSSCWWRSLPIVEAESPRHSLPILSCSQVMGLRDSQDQWTGGPIS